MPQLVSSIKFHAKYNAFVSLQEALHHQLMEILEQLGPEWSYAGVGRDDGKEKGEYSPILYRNDEWELLDTKTYWLSDTPDQPSRGWDAALPRILTFARFRNKWSQGVVSMFNTHFDHQGVEAREKSAELIVKLIDRHCQGKTAVVTGDFNSESDDPGYKYLSKHMNDAHVTVANEDKYGHSLSCTGFDETHDRPTRIDFVWLTKDIDILSYGILHSEFHQFKFSDHRPVMARIEHKFHTL